MQITPRHLGLIYCLGYVFLEAFQAVYLGSLFLQVDSFRVGAWVFGLALILVSILFLAVITLSGHSGFVRGGWATALAGVMLSVISGTATAYVILLSVKWHEQGVGPVIQYRWRSACRERHRFGSGRRRLGCSSRITHTYHCHHCHP